MAKELDRFYNLLVEASNALDDDCDNGSKAGFLKRIEIQKALERVMNLTSAYDRWLEQLNDPSYQPSDTWAEHRGER